jgi:eukaryotic-like serine/threonine-protein kinase
MRPREQLEGERLSGGWIVGKMLQKKSSTGSNFSVGYLVVNDDGRHGYLKAMDYLEAFRAPDTAAALKAFAEMYLFEKQICEACRDYHLDRVVHAIASGSILPDPGNPFGKVEYLIFELADSDIRYHLDSRPDFDTAFMLRILHNVATGLQQLHIAEMAHQDLKPSNILIINQEIGSKIADLGRAWAKAFPAPHDSYDIAGDPGYAPPELLYRDVPVDSRRRRFGCDLYHFGSLIVFVFARAHMNSLIVKYLGLPHRPRTWGGTFEDVLPYLKAAFGAALAELDQLFPAELKNDLGEMVKQLCEPNPTERGHPLNRQINQNQFSLERYISKLNLLASRAELTQARSN